MRYLILIFYITVSGISFAQFKGEIRMLNGKKHKVHHIQAGETLYALSREYKIDVDKILESNPVAKDGLNIGQEILIPAPKESIKGKTHIVVLGETLFSISKKYNVDIEEIQKLNSMTGVDLSLGQELIIQLENSSTPIPDVAPPSGSAYAVSKGETLFSISRKFGVSVEAIEKINGIEGKPLSVGQKLVIPGNASGGQDKKTDVKADVKTEPKDSVVNTEAIKKNEVKVEKESEKPDVIIDTTPTTTDNFVEVEESGVAELIPDTENTRKYLALHRTVKPGTIIRVRNEMNGREVWARIIGKLPSTGENSNVLVKVSKAAFDRLGAVDKKFRVTITYIP